ncbi:Type II secretion system (T2SS), protein F [uncultured archaeon]|nr:Type II secretion system (T2SS), protein F [uncultured archaeon]
MALNFESLGRLFTREQMRGFGKAIHSAGIIASAEAFAGYLTAIVLTMTFFLTIVLFLLPTTQKLFLDLVLAVLGPLGLPLLLVKLVTLLALLVVAFLVVVFATYTVVSAVLILLGEARKNAVEAVLPDFLTLIGANVRAGMTIDQAIWYAAKPEFGILSIEVRAVIKGAFSGESLHSALDRLGERFDSPVLSRTIALIKQASVTGGEVAKILEMTASDARETAMLKKDIAASLLIYEIFVVFSSALGAPFLFAVVNRLLGILEKSFAFLPQTAAQTVAFIKPAAPLITSTDFFYFSLATMFVTTLISAFIIGVVQTGSKNQGFKYFPFMLIAAYLVYFVVSSALDSFFAGLLI